jgi:sulfur-oxidizing protein SoxB
MALSRRDFLQTLALASASGLTLDNSASASQRLANDFYDLKPFGNVHLLHFTDSHAQLLPTYYREPSINLGYNEQFGQVPHLVGESLLKHFGFAPHTRQAYAFTHLDFQNAAKQYGRVGGFAHLSTLIQQIKAHRKDALVLDGGDTWQGSATALWTQAQDMVDASLALGVDVMTAHWEMTLGEERVLDIVNKDFKNKISFVAQNIQTSDFGDPVFDPYVMKLMNGVQVAIIGQAFPYTPIANPSYFVPNWTFGIAEESLQKTIDQVRSLGAKVVVLLSHNGTDVDLKLASRVSGLDAILGGHTHDAVAVPITVKNKSGVTLVTNAGSNSKFLGVLDFEVKSGRVTDFRYKLLPVFSELIAPDEHMSHLIQKIRQPFEDRLGQVLAHTAEPLYRRGNFNGTFDELTLQALLKVKDAEIAFSPGFRWGSSLIGGQPITFEDVMNQTAITYPNTTLSEISGEMIKFILEDVADNVFNPDPYYQQGGDMVRVAGLTYKIDPTERIGRRISDLMANGRPLDPSRLYKVAGWGSVSKEAQNANSQPIWDVLSSYLKDIREVGHIETNTPVIKGASSNPGFTL